jgi:Asp/Glu/hydantoin racemase
MRTVLLMNPNTTRAMTEQMAAVAARCLPEGVAIETMTATVGLPVIASREAYEAAAHETVKMYGRSDRSHEAAIIGCFGDPGLEALRDVARAPVLGLAESSIREADALGEPFAILTMGNAWVDILNERVALAAPRMRFVGVFAGEGTGLDLSRRGAWAVEELDRLGRKAVAAGARTLILGGGALAGLTKSFGTNAQCIDCVEATIRAALRLMRNTAPTRLP